MHSPTFSQPPTPAANPLAAQVGLFICELEERLELAAVVATALKCLADEGIG